jgi:2-polyprenyl-3-methyl-5-hydroxy-6-metoxy-1,4-benzoquinol methylase
MDARRLEGEWLDELPADDPRARRSRADLARINAIMGNARIVASEFVPGTSRRLDSRQMPTAACSFVPGTITDIGAGDGAFALALARRLKVAGLRVTLVDRQRIVSPQTLAGFRDAGAAVDVAQDDVFEWLERPGPQADAIVANLFLHHFEDEPLRRMLALIARRTRFFVACETRRSTWALASARMLGVIGCNDVTRHDAVASVRAGFRDGQLAALWPAGAWKVTERGAGLFSHLFVARRSAL